MSAMEKLNTLLEEKFMPVAGRIADQKHVQAIRDGILLTMPLLIIGSIFLVLAFLPIPGYSQFMNGIFGEVWMSKLLYPVGVTFDLMAVFACIGISYRLCEKYKVDPLSGATISLVSFMLVTPFSIMTQNGPIHGIPTALMGSKGLFVAMIMSVLSTEIYRKTVQKKIIIKMPASVPPSVSKSFAALIPATIVVFISWIIRLAFEYTSFESIHFVVEKILVGPLTSLGGTYWGMIVVIVLVKLLWIAGIHGSAIVLGITSPVFTTLMDQNRMAFQAGQELPHIVTMQLFDLYMNMGGSGCTFALAILLLIKSRSQQLKEIGKLSIGAAFFNINEPIIFGMPIVMNPIMMIPFILAPVTVMTISYLGMKFGLVAKLAGIAIPWTSPVIIGGYLASGGKISAAIMQLVGIIVAGLIYYPFFKIWDKQKADEEGLFEAKESLSSEI
jgi:PTS system cellobiose-specific IIC component